MSPFHPARWPERLPHRYWLARAQVPARVLGDSVRKALGAALRGPAAVGPVALLVEEGRIAAIERQAPGGAATFDLDGALVLPAFADAHTHLDKGDLLAAGLAPERDLFAAVTKVREDYARWSAAELRARMCFALATAMAYGTRAINTYVDWPDLAAPEGPLAFGVLLDLQREWAGRIELRITSLAAIDGLADAAAAETLARLLAASRRATGAHGAAAPPRPALGLFIYPGAPLQWLPRAFDLAERYDLDLDFHIDEHLSPAVANLGHVARLARERGFGTRTVCGHACVLSVLPGPDCARLLDEVAAAGITLVSLPHTNLYLQDSGAEPAAAAADATPPPPPRRTPRLRGLLPVHEARTRGIPLAFASDNHRDLFHPGGDLDLLQTLSLAATAAQLDDAVFDWAHTITIAPARLMGLAWDGSLEAGAPADLVLHPGRHSAEILSRPHGGRQVLRGGQRLAPAEASPPDFRELAWPSAPSSPYASRTLG